MSACSIDAIQVGQRHRHDLGDIAALAESMTESGLLHPVVITADHRLIAGARRLAAAKRLGWTEIDVTVARNISDVAAMLRAEEDENTCRKDFLPSEAAAIRKARAELLKPLAVERKKAGRPSGKLPEGASDTRDAAAVGTGYSGRTLDKVDHVAAVAADDSQPKPVREVAQQALADMDATGKVDPAYEVVRRAETHQAETTLLAAVEQRVPGAADDMAAKKVRRRWASLIAATAEIATMSPQAVAAVLTEDELAAARLASRSASEFIRQVSELRRPGLRVAGGTK